MANKKKVRFEDRFISPLERRERVLVLMPSRGFANLNQLSESMGLTWTGLNKSLTSDRVSAEMICKLAFALDCSISYLLER